MKLAMHLYLAIFDRSSRHMIAVEGVELTGAVLQSLTFGDFHNMTAAVLQLLHEQNDGKRFCHQAIQVFLTYIVFLHHAVIGGFTTVGVGGGDNCVAGTDHLLRGESLSRFHLTDTQCSGCRSEQTPKGTPDRSSVWAHPKRVTVWTTLLRTFPSSSSFARSNSCHPFSMVKVLFSLGMMERIQLINVVLPLPVEPVTQKHRGMRRHILQKNMGGQTVLHLSAGDGRRNNGRTKVIPQIILDNKDRADAALLGADHLVQVCIEQIAMPDSLPHKLTS